MTASADATTHAKSPPTAPPPPPPPPSTRTPEPADRLSTRATLRRCILWVVIASVAGTTSFILGLTGNQASPTAMLLGILLYGCFIGLVSSSGGFRRRLQQPFVARSFKIGYGIRLAACIVPGAAMAVDMFPGMLAVMAGETLEREVGFGKFASTLVSTLVQGTLINILILLAVTFVWLLQKMFMEWKPPVRDVRACAGCGYHLETLEADTYAICPECGRTNEGLNDRRAWIDRASWPKFLLVVIASGIGGILVQAGTFLVFG